MHSSTATTHKRRAVKDNPQHLKPWRSRCRGHVVCLDVAIQRSKLTQNFCVCKSRDMSHQFPKRHVLKEEMNWLQLYSSLSPSHRTTGAVSGRGVGGGWGWGWGRQFILIMTASRHNAFGAIQTERPSHIATVPLVSPNESNGAHKMGHMSASTKHLIDFL